MPVEELSRLTLFERQAEAMEKYALAMRVGPVVTDMERDLMGQLLRQSRGIQTIIARLRRFTTAE